MASRLSDSADTSEKEGGDDVAKEVGSSQSSQANKPIPRKDVFLSHSGKQKNFVRQLHRDLTNQGVSCFFDEDRESLPVGEDFTIRIFEAAKTCKAAVLLLSEDFPKSEWAMRELSAFVKARDTTPRTNPNLKIIPLFFKISLCYLKKITPDNKEWLEMPISKEQRAQWRQDLNVLTDNNGLKFSEGGDEVKFRDDIVREIRDVLPPPSPRYHVPCMQGQVRMCKEVADFFKALLSDENRVRIGGLYGMPGNGKTTLGKAFCNFKLDDFHGRVCHLEFFRGDSFERLKLALQYLTFCSPSLLRELTNEEQARGEFNNRVKDQKVLLVLDNITEESVDEVKYYVEVYYRKDSCIFLSARSVDVLVHHFRMESQSCMRVPRLEDDEAIRILLEPTSVQESTLEDKDKKITLKCANRCSFKEVSGSGPTFNPLALKAFGGYLFSKYGSILSNWDAEIEGLVNRSGDGLDDLFAVTGNAFDNMRREYRTIFMLLTVYMLPNISTHKVAEWLAINCNKEISFVEKAVQDLRKKAFVEEVTPEIRIYDLYIEFARSKANEMGKWLCWEGDPRSTRGLISSEDNAGFELAKLEQCMHRRPSQVDPRDFQNLLVLQLVDVRNMSNLDLGGMGRLRSIRIHKCKDLTALEGMTKLQQLAWLQISEVNQMFRLPELSSLNGLQHLEIDIPESRVFNQLGDLTGCVFLREINVFCASLLEFPRLNGLPHLEKVLFKVRGKVEGALDCTGCEQLQRIDFESDCLETSSPLLDGCTKLKLTETRFEAM